MSVINNTLEYVKDFNISSTFTSYLPGFATSLEDIQNNDENKDNEPDSTKSGTDNSAEKSAILFTTDITPSIAKEFQAPSKRSSSLSRRPSRPKETCCTKTLLIFSLIIVLLSTAGSGGVGVLMYSKFTQQNSSENTLKLSIKNAKNMISNWDASLIRKDEFFPDKLRVTQVKVLEMSPKNCKEVRKGGVSRDGVYSIYVLGKKVDVFCDMSSPGGGWTVIQKRFDGSVDFNKGFSDYENGFGDKNGEYWLGLKIIRGMTYKEDFHLKVELENFSGNKAYALYSKFYITDKSTHYAIQVEDYQGNGGDALSSHNKHTFNTFDRSSGNASKDCGNSFPGAWWLEKCDDLNLNGAYISRNELTPGKGIIWNAWRNNTNTSLKKVEMKILNN